MTPDERYEGRHDLAAVLPPLMPEPARAARVRARCGARLDRRRQRSRRLAAILQFGRHVVAPAILAGLCALYIAHAYKTLAAILRI